MKKIIGFLGKRKAGKNIAASLCKQIFEKQNMSATIDAFAVPIKITAKAIYGFSEDQLEGYLKETKSEYWGNSPRYFMQLIGTELFRKHNPDIWVKSLEYRMINDCSEIYLISDVRFFNEVNLIKKYNGFLVKLERNIIRNNKTDEHQSEVELDNFQDYDCLIDNNGTISELKNKLANEIAKL